MLNYYKYLLSKTFGIFIASNTLILRATDILDILSSVAI